MTRPLRLGMVGGGEGAFIGAVHRIAARLDGQYTLVAGAFSSRPAVAQASGALLGLPPERVYETFEEMARKEAARVDGAEVVAIVTPNHLHFAPAKAFLEVGIHVICDKPMTATLEEAEALAALGAKAGAQFLLTQTYTGYPMVREARRMVLAGCLGQVRVIQAEYAQGWLSQAVETEQAGAAWRVDPAKSGKGGAIGDIGTHAYNLVRFVTGLEVEALAAELHRFVAGRRLDDNAHIMMRLAQGARGMLWVSQVAIGKENGLRLRLYGDHGSLEWSQETPNHLLYSRQDAPMQVLTRGGAGTEAIVRVPSGHPEGYLEAFASLYRDFALQLQGQQTESPLPGLQEGVEGLRFVEAVIRSNAGDGVWTQLP